MEKDCSSSGLHLSMDKGNGMAFRNRVLRITH
nr:MAG TPA: hypothetical protein [Caudoviricetes sp.]